MKLTKAPALVAALSLSVSVALTSTTAAQAADAGSPSALAASSATSPAAASPSPSPSSAAAQAALARLTAKLPADWKDRQAATFARLGIDRSPVRDVLDARLAEAINPDDYVCGPTKLDAYVDSLLADVDPNTLLVLALVGVLDFPTYEAIYYGSPKDPGFALTPASASVLSTSFGYAQRFWDVKLDDVQLLAMHGTMLTDVDRVARVVALLYGTPPADSLATAREIVKIVRTSPGLERGRNPIFTLNAFAFSAQGETDPVVSRLRDKLVFGDGILDALRALGLKQVGPKAVMGHEMAHHVQYEDNLFDSELTGPEATRRTELMADSFGTYFSTHKKGLGLNANQLLLVQDTFYDVGDCQFTSNGHHGTPNQRRAAASWGIATAAAGDQVSVLPSLRLAARFDRILPKLVAPDAPVTPNAYRQAAKDAA